jgi:hypothetical protein
MMSVNPVGAPPAPLPAASFDGIGNNVAHPTWGSTGQDLLRVSPAAYGDGISTPSGADRPNARLVSNLLSASPEGGITNDRDFTAFVYAWGQFLDHDLGLTDTAAPRERLPIAVPAGDPSFDPTGTGTMTIPMSRSAYDPATGTTRVDKFTAVDDFGTIINPMIVEGQVHGGLVQGIGQALIENCVYDRETGQLLTGSFMDYAMPRADDFPDFKIDTICTPCTHNPLGTKGCGEAGAIGSPPAVINAVLDALKSVGVTELDMPASASRVWEAIQAAK